MFLPLLKAKCAAEIGVIHHLFHRLIRCIAVSALSSHLHSVCSKSFTCLTEHVSGSLGSKRRRSIGALVAGRQVQQLGRTHRSNQVQPPKYLIVSSDISGETRFASAVAKRLEQLGALTHGDRHASSASDALSSSNLQTRCPGRRTP